MGSVGSLTCSAQESDKPGHGMHYAVYTPKEDGDDEKSEDPALLQVDMVCMYRLASMVRKALGR
jgi:hypothetical protein